MAMTTTNIDRALSADIGYVVNLTARREGAIGRYSDYQLHVRARPKASRFDIIAAVRAQHGLETGHIRAVREHRPI